MISSVKTQAAFVTRSCVKSIRLNSTAAAVTAGKTVSAKATEIASIAPAGTKLKGCNIRKNGEDPVALPESEYPEWLWTVMEKKETDPEKIMRNERRKVTRQKIKANNFMASMSK